MARRSLLPLLALLSCLVLLRLPAAHAEQWKQRMASAFDPPLSVQTVPAHSDAESGTELRCTAYRDIVIRETGTDTPAPGPAAILAVGARRPACAKPPGARDIALSTENYSFVGRKGPFLLFEATDPNGAIPFVLLASGTGKVIYSDSMTEDGIAAVALDDGALHIKFRRGINGPCSLAKEGAACWAKFVAAAAIPPSVTPPPAKICTVAYSRNKAPPDDPSLVFFDVDIVVGLDGTSQLKAVGTAGCTAMP
jgi:hypothetical protein